jgi:fermentation-respiration switch protein FrsA (DUF1100 family)
MYLIWRGLVFYLILVGLLALLQRKMMYPAGRAGSLDADLFPGLAETFYSADDVDLKTPDGVTIRGWYLKVAEKPSDRLILLFHGNGGHRAHRENWYIIAHSLKADVLAMDYHGYGDSEGSPSEKNLIADAQATWSHATKELKYRPDQIVIVGESLGGGVSVQLAAERCRATEEPAGLVLVATFSSMVDAASSHYPWLPVRYVLLDRYRSDKHIGDVSCPILQFHGDVDTIVPIRLAKKLHETAPAKSSSGKARILTIFPGTTHNDVLYRNGREVRDQMAKFISETP